MKTKQSKEPVRHYESKGKRLRNSNERQVPKDAKRRKTYILETSQEEIKRDEKVKRSKFFGIQDRNYKYNIMA